MKTLVGQAPTPAAEPQLGAELYLSAGSAGDLVAGVLQGSDKRQATRYSPQPGSC